MTENNKRFYLKDDVKLDDIYFMNEVLLAMFIWTNSWCNYRGISPHWTSFHRLPGDGISVSETHQEYRAMDISLLPLFGWTETLKEQYETDFYSRFKDVGAIVFDEKLRQYISKPIYVHGEPGSSIHAHIQIRRNIESKETDL